LIDFNIVPLTPPAQVPLSLADEMAGYGTVRTYAQLLGMPDHARVLQQTLDEEGMADKKLTALAESGVNLDAATGA
jgi:ferritin-like metal-binding protein YciE